MQPFSNTIATLSLAACILQSAAFATTHASGFIAPRSTPPVTPATTPRGTPRGTPYGTPYGTPHPSPRNLHPEHRHTKTPTPTLPEQHSEKNRFSWPSNPLSFVSKDPGHSSREQSRSSRDQSRSSREQSASPGRQNASSEEKIDTPKPSTKSYFRTSKKEYDPTGKRGKHRSSTVVGDQSVDAAKGKKKYNEGKDELTDSPKRSQSSIPLSFRSRDKQSLESQVLGKAEDKEDKGKGKERARDSSSQSAPAIPLDAVFDPLAALFLRIRGLMLAGTTKLHEPMEKDDSVREKPVKKKLKSLDSFLKTFGCERIAFSTLDGISVMTSLDYKCLPVAYESLKHEFDRFRAKSSSDGSKTISDKGEALKEEVMKDQTSVKSMEDKRMHEQMSIDLFDARVRASTEECYTKKGTAICNYISRDDIIPGREPKETKATMKYVLQLSLGRPSISLKLNFEWKDE